jgi:hypothetical protein
MDVIDKVLGKGCMNYEHCLDELVINPLVAEYM